MAAAPTSPHMARYRSAATDDPDDPRLHSPVFSRNSPPMIVALAPLFGGLRGRVLEIGSGTGQHAAAFRLAFPGLDWIASDPDPLHRASALAWAREMRLPDRPALDIDASGDWPALPEVRALGPLAGVVSMNVIHIAPISVAEGIVRGAGSALGPGGLLVFYGPFRENGVHTGEGNARFDAGLRAENPAWGVRDTGEIGRLAEAVGLSFAALQGMPANNRLLVFRKG